MSAKKKNNLAVMLGLSRPQIQHIFKEVLPRPLSKECDPEYIELMEAWRVMQRCMSIIADRATTMWERKNKRGKSHARR